MCVHDDIILLHTHYSTVLVLTPLFKAVNFTSSIYMPSCLRHNKMLFIEDTKLDANNCRMSIKV
jgi:hypothetical protein